MKIRFFEGGYGNYNGYGVVSAAGTQTSETQSCKEVFSRRLRDTSATKAGTVMFFRKDERAKTDELAENQEKVLHTFEKALSIEPPAKVEVLVHNYERKTYDWTQVGGFKINKGTEKVLLYTVSAGWRKSVPLMHILALLVRNYYPLEGRKDWRTILNWMKTNKVMGDAVTQTAKEIVLDGGEIIGGIRNSGISSYATSLLRKRKEIANLAKLTQDFKVDRLKNYAS